MSLLRLSFFRYLRAKARFKLEISNASDQMLPKRNRLCHGFNRRTSRRRILWCRCRSPAKTVIARKQSFFYQIFDKLRFQMPSPEKWRHRRDLSSQCACFPSKSKIQFIEFQLIILILVPNIRFWRLRWIRVNLGRIQQKTTCYLPALSNEHFRSCF